MPCVALDPPDSRICHSDGNPLPSIRVHSFIQQKGATRMLFKPGICVAVAVLVGICSRAQSVHGGAGAGYLLGPDDQVILRAIDAPEISEKPFLIGLDGSITLPLVGRVRAGGLTVGQFEAELDARLTQYLKDPQVAVTVAEFRSQPVSVFGAVTKPGIVQLRGHKTLYEVLSMAGGPSENAGSTLTLTRRREEGDIPLPGATVDKTGQVSSAVVNMQQILDGRAAGADIEVKPNDTISVSQANSNMIYVVGDVEHGGAFSLGGRERLSVLKALSLAGGLGRTAKPDKARIIRGTAGQESEKEKTVNINQIMKGKADDVMLQPQDILVIPTSSRKVFSTYSVPSVVSAAAYAAIYHY
jgi:polysaccharide biosynthesis/export protein